MDETTKNAIAKAVLVVMGTTLGAGVVPNKGVTQVTGRQIFALPVEVHATHDETHHEARGSAGITMRRPVAQTSARALHIEASDLVRLEDSGKVFRLA